MLTLSWLTGGWERAVAVSECWQKPVCRSLSSCNLTHSLTVLMCSVPIIHLSWFLITVGWADGFLDVKTGQSCTRRSDLPAQVWDFVYVQRYKVMGLQPREVEKTANS